MRKNRGVGGPRSLPVAEWKRRIQALQDSGLTLTAFCRREGICRDILQGWRRKLEGAGQSAAGHGKRVASPGRERPLFAEVQVRSEGAVPEAKSPAPSPLGVVIILSSGDQLFLSDACDPAWLGKVVRAFRSGPC